MHMLTGKNTPDLISDYPSIRPDKFRILNGRYTSGIVWKSWYEHVKTQIAGDANDTWQITRDKPHNTLNLSPMVEKGRRGSEISGLYLLTL